MTPLETLGAADDIARAVRKAGIAAATRTYDKAVAAHRATYHATYDTAVAAYIAASDAALDPAKATP